MFDKVFNKFLMIETEHFAKEESMVRACTHAHTQTHRGKNAHMGVYTHAGAHRRARARACTHIARLGWRDRGLCVLCMCVCMCVCVCQVLDVMADVLTREEKEKIAHNFLQGLKCVHTHTHTPAHLHTSACSRATLITMAE